MIEKIIKQSRALKIKKERIRTEKNLKSIRLEYFKDSNVNQMF